MVGKLLFTNRFGGVSKAPYDSLNLAFHVGDKRENVKKNREILSKEFGGKKIQFCSQVHSNRVEVVEEYSEFLECDGLITTNKNLALAIMVADCLPILIFEKNWSVICALHAGRNGSLLNISKNAIEILKDRFSVLPKDLIVYIGPGIGSCCYEIKEDIIKIVKANGYEDFIVKKDDKSYLDLKELNLFQLQNCGVLKENIKKNEICTSCNRDYFSYRRDGECGRFAGVISF
jgi:YfiH family protein